MNKKTDQPIDSNQIFFDECFSFIQEINHLLIKIENNPSQIHFFDPIFRKIHTMKGGLSMVPLSQDLSSLLHSFETIISDFKKNIFEIDLENFDFYYYLTTQIHQNLKELQNEGQISLNSMEQHKLLMAALQKIKNQNGSLKNVRTFWRSESIESLNSSDQTGVWLSNEQMDKLQNLTNELIILRNFQQMMVHDENAASPQFNQSQLDFIHSLSRVTNEIQNELSRSMRVEFSKITMNLPRIIRQISATCKKKVHVETLGFNIQIERKIGQILFDCLIHLVRNSIDHGIESPQDREELGKKSVGQIVLQIWEAEGIIKLRVSDDGAGVDLEKVKTKIINSQLANLAELQSKTKEEILNYVFLPGFSTRENANSISGRGIGMDVVANTIKAHGGTVKLSSQTGTGTEFLIELPVPKKIMIHKTVLTKSQNKLIAFPMEAVESMTTLKQNQIMLFQKNRVGHFDGQTIPLMTIEEFRDNRLHLDLEEVHKKSVIILRSQDKKIGILVDSIEQQLDIVVRPFPSLVKKQRGFKGTSVLSQNKIAFIVSPDDFKDLIFQNQLEAA